MDSHRRAVDPLQFLIRATRSRILCENVYPCAMAVLPICKSCAPIGLPLAASVADSRA